MTIDNVLEILEKHKLHIPSNVFYELKADIVNFEEPTNDDCAERNGCKTCSLDESDDCCRKLFEESMQEPTTKDDAPENNVGNIEPTTKNDLGVDCIDRNSIKYYPGTGGYMYASKGEIDKLPSVTPQEPRKGHWILRPHIYGVAFCSECGFELKINNTNYCPNCGADMRSKAESEGW